MDRAADIRDGHPLVRWCLMVGCLAAVSCSSDSPAATTASVDQGLRGMNLEITVEDSFASVSMRTGGRLALSGDSASCSTDAAAGLSATTYSGQPWRFDLVTPEFSEFLVCDLVLARQEFTLDFRLSAVAADACEVVNGHEQCIFVAVEAGDFEVDGFILRLSG